MISSKSFDKQRILEISSKIGKRGDPKLIEKILHALLLVEKLSNSGIDMVFKGGTSVFLLIESPARFSIDVDIIVSQTKDALPEYFDKITDGSHFLRWIEDGGRKNENKAPVVHYKFFYQSVMGSFFGEEPILLDVLLTENPLYKKTIDLPVHHEWLITETPFQRVKMPTIESLLGDKLTAFAPKTTGILFTKERPVEIIKQLFDIALLFDKAVDYHEVKETYLTIVNQEISYRNLSIKPGDVLADTFETCLLLTKREYNSYEFRFLQKGINNIVNFIIKPFRIDDAIICASKVALLTKIIESGDYSPIPRFTSSEMASDLKIETPGFEKIARLKKTNPEAFYYWYFALKNR